MLIYNFINFLCLFISVTSLDCFYYFTLCWGQRRVLGQKSSSKKCEDLSARSRWNNVQLVGLPEGSEAQLLQDLLGLEAYRTVRAKLKEGEPPRPMVIRVTLFQVKNDILNCAGEASPLLYNGKRVHVLPDFTPTLAKQKAFINVKKELHSCAQVKFSLRYPATLHITMWRVQTHRFEDREQGLEFVNKKLKRTTVPEGD